VGGFSGATDVPDLLGVHSELRGDEVIVTQDFDRDVALNDLAASPRRGATVVVGAREFDLDRDGATGWCYGCTVQAAWLNGGACLDLGTTFGSPAQGRGQSFC
jgi:hypothetical protein